MQTIPYDIIGTSLHQIWHGSAAAAPPIHIWVENQLQDEQFFFLGINTLWEHIEEGEQLPSAVLIIAFNAQMGGGPYFLYWVEDERPELMARVEEWRAKHLGGRPIKKITAMGIGNSLF